MSKLSVHCEVHCEVVIQDYKQVLILDIKPWEKSTLHNVIEGGEAITLGARGGVPSWYITSTFTVSQVM